MKKTFTRFLSIILTLILLSLSLSTAALNIFAASAQNNTVTFNNPAIPANAGDTVDLSTYAVEFTKGSVTDSGISWSSSEITVSNNKVSPSAKGVYKLTAQSGSTTKTVYLVVKAASETEYVLYYDDFSADTLANYTKSGNCSIADGKLVLNSKNANDAYVLLPSWLSDFGNYSITTSVNMKEADNISRWLSVMYRVKSPNSPFFQMAVRQNAKASNGVELAHNISGIWGYHFQGAYSTDLLPSSYYTLGIDAYNNNVSISINDSLVTSTAEATQIDCGNVGLRSNKSLVYFDYIKVTARFNSTGMPTTPADTRAVKSGITLAPSMIYEIKSSDDLEKILTDSPAVAIMTLGSDGNILDAKNSPICPLADAIEKLEQKVVPAVRLATGFDVNEAVTKLSSLKLKEIILISDSASVLKAARKASRTIIGVYDMSKKSISADKLTATRAATLDADARICILPASLATQRNTEFLNTRGVIAWYEASENTELEMFSLVTSGANGIVTADRALMESVLTSPIFKENSIIRPVGVIGHRGVPSLAPANSIEGSVYAAQCGANIIENDVFLTKDGVVVIMHDDTIDGTTNGSGKVENFTYAELCNYQIDIAPSGSTSGLPTISAPVPIPTLEEYFEAFKDTDTFLFIEIKSGNKEIVPAIKKLIDKYDIADQCGVISFGAGMLQEVRKIIPEISVGFLYSEKGLDPIMSNTSNIGSSYNPSYTSASKELVSELAARGIFTWPWTVNNKADFDNLYLMGVAGITTDHAYYAADYVRFISTDKTEYTLAPNKELDIKLTVETFASSNGKEDLSNNTYNTKKAEMILLSGNDTLKYSSGKLCATEEGDATVLFRLEYTLQNGKKAYVYTQPITVHSTLATDSTETAPIETTSTDAPESDLIEEAGCGSTISATTVIGAIAALGMGIVFKKKD